MKIALCAAGILIASTMAVPEATPVAAQTSSPSICTASNVSPMQGTYTGVWHSDGDYTFDGQFATFNTQVELKITIDGTLGLAVTPEGQVSGTASGQVQAPIFHDGTQDISSGYGTISGQVEGNLADGAPSLTLQAPVIDMHWGTFGGHAIERLITMPDYHLPTGGIGCVSASGTVNEQGFPVQNLVADYAGQITQAPGVGVATGTWQATSGQATAFASLSEQVDSFISSANTTLHSTSLTSAEVTQNVVVPLQQLETTIRQNPDVSRCLLERLGSWEVSTLPVLFSRAQGLAAGAQVTSLRQARDLLTAANALNLDCGVPDGGAGAAILAADRSHLDGAVRQTDWTSAALWLREALLLGGTGSEASTTQELNADFHSLVLHHQHPGADTGRAAFAFGDTTDAGLVARALLSHLHQKRHQSTSRVLLTGIPTIRVSASTASPYVFSWQPVPGASSYVVTAGDRTGLSWAWAGTASSVTYGDTSIPGSGDTAQDSWPDTPPTFTWSVVAVSKQGRIVGAHVQIRS